MSRVFAVIFICLILLTGCGKSETPSHNKVAQEEKPLLIGLIPERSIFKQMERYEPLANYLSQKVGRQIVMKILPRYGNIIKNFVSLQLDGAFFGSFTGAMAQAKLGVIPLARPEGFDGVSTYHGLIIVRKDSGIKTANDMKNKTFAFVDKATTAGYLLPLEYFAEHGIRDYKKYLKETYFAGTHVDVIYDVLYKKADIGAAKNTIFEQLATNDGRIKNELLVLEKSPVVPENGLAVRKDLDKSIGDKLKETLLNMHTDPEGIKVLKGFGAQRFIETTHQDYEPVFKYARHINLDLAKYDYMNE